MLSVMAIPGATSTTESEGHVREAPPSHWVIRRKAEVVAAVRGGLLSLEEACSRYTLTVEEFLAWQYSRRISRNCLT